MTTNGWSDQSDIHFSFFFKKKKNLTLMLATGRLCDVVANVVIKLFLDYIMLC
jgi:hypothetical protein